MEKILHELKTRLAKAKLTEGKRQSDFAITFLRGASAATEDPNVIVQINDLLVDVATDGVSALPA